MHDPHPVHADRSHVTIRAARPDDAETIAALIRELAEYEKLAHEAQATPEALLLYLFGLRPYAEALIAEWDGRPAGFALFFHNFSTFQGRPGLYLEDLYVRNEHRGRGIGTALLTHLAGIAVERGCGRLEWSVLDWNAPAIGFYQAIGARPMDEWTVYRLDGAALARLARRGGGSPGDDPRAAPQP
jgi:GNAT superfamily N-acetyltransferase